MNKISTFYANIYVGLREGYDNKHLSINRVHGVCRTFCNKVKLCVTVTPTTYHYVDGRENGAIVGLINYPRFPATPAEIKQKAIDLARILKKDLKQKRVSIVMPNETIMIGERRIEVTKQ